MVRKNNNITRRQFLKKAGWVTLGTGALCMLPDLLRHSTAEANGTTEIEFDGAEIVAKVGHTFASIHMVPRFGKGIYPDIIEAKVQYGTDPTFSTYSESEIVASEYDYKPQRGIHVGPDGSSMLVSKKRLYFPQWGIDIGDPVYNDTDGSVMYVSEVVNHRKLAGTLVDGVRNTWNYGDKWRIDRTYYRLEVPLSNLEPNTRYYYRVVLRMAGYPWNNPRPIHSFHTRRNPSSRFKFAILADAHRNVLRNKYHWPEWDIMMDSLRSEQVDFLIDLGDGRALTNGHGVPHYKFYHALYAIAMKPFRSGFQNYRGTDAVCSDCCYFFVRGNHEGLSNYQTKRTRKRLADLLKRFIPNPDGSIYPEGGSHDNIYDQGYYAFTWGDALFVIMDVLRYKDRIGGPARFDIGNAQLQWLQDTLSNSSAPWKFIFMHHLFGGGRSYGRGGANYAFVHEQANIQSLANQYGAHIFFGHDHVLAHDYADGVLYYTAGCGWGSQFTEKILSSLDRYYPNGFTPASCKSQPPTCENNGYVVVDVDGSEVVIQYKGYQGNVIDEIVLTK